MYKLKSLLSHAMYSMHIVNQIRRYGSGCRSLHIPADVTGGLGAATAPPTRAIASWFIIKVHQYGAHIQIVVSTTSRCIQVQPTHIVQTFNISRIPKAVKLNEQILQVQLNWIGVTGVSKHADVLRKQSNPGREF